MKHLIFEGAELAGKSWLMSQVYERLETKYNQSGNILDGCHWLNADVGIFGSPEGKAVIKNYVKIFQVLKEKNIIVEKFHISDVVYNQIYNQKKISYSSIEKKLSELEFKIIFVKFKANKALLEKRIADRLNLYPHYQKVLKTPDWYITQQETYTKALKKSSLPVLEIETDVLPDSGCVEKILEWIGENEGMTK